MPTSLNKWINSIAESGRDLLSRRSKNGKNVWELCAELYSIKGEAMGTALACAVTDAYQAMNKEGKLAFFQMLATDYSPDPKEITAAAKAYTTSPDSEHLIALNKAAESPRKQLFRRINMSSTGTHTLVGMRSDLQAYLKEHPELNEVDYDLKQLLKSWFNRGFLEIHSIDWKTPAHILEKLIAYEAVHEMNGWDDLRRRLEDDRRCFAFFHPALKDEPLIFVEVALVNGLATAVQPLLAPRKQNAKQAKPNAAIFYSISNCQQGLKGISFGNFLIKQVVMELRKELPQLKKFATLSPIPGFRHWLDKELANEATTLFSSEERPVIEQINQENWHRSSTLRSLAKPLLMRLCAHYLYEEKQGTAPLDPVARFHLGNGAQIEQLNWMGDISKNGFKQSAGILVNYRYELKKVEENHEAYVNENKVVHSKKFGELLDEKD